LAYYKRDNEEQTKNQKKQHEQRAAQPFRCRLQPKTLP